MADLGLLEAFSALDEGNDEAKPVSKSCNDKVSSAVGVDADDSSKGLFEADDELASGDMYCRMPLSRPTIAVLIMLYAHSWA